MKKIILAFDSFKGSVNSIELGENTRKAILKEYPNCQVLSLPIADGGEGTTEVLSASLNAMKVTCKVHDPLMNEIEVSYGITQDRTTAILEMASASGLPLVAQIDRNPLYTTTYGVGEMVLDALNRGCRKFLIGIGGSATNDAGIGVLSALGVRFLDSEGHELEPIGASLSEIYRIDTSNLEPSLQESIFTIACDVNNPFSGEQGAAYIYAPQKGANSLEVASLDNGLKHYAKVIKQHTRMDISNIPGAGAAGGMGGGLLPFLNAQLESGIDTILNAVNFEKVIRGADVIFTGEGKLDAQTAMGKALGGVLRLAEKQNIPVIAIGGCIDSDAKLNEMGLLAALSIQPSPVSLQESLNPEFAKQHVARVALQMLNIIKHFRQ